MGFDIKLEVLLELFHVMQEVYAFPCPHSEH